MANRFLFAIILLGGGLAAMFINEMLSVFLVGAGVIWLFLPAREESGGDE